MLWSVRLAPLARKVTFNQVAFILTAKGLVFLFFSLLSNPSLNVPVMSAYAFSMTRSLCEPWPGFWVIPVLLPLCCWRFEPQGRHFKGKSERKKALLLTIVKHVPLKTLVLSLLLAGHTSLGGGDYARQCSSPCS